MSVSFGSLTSSSVLTGKVDSSRRNGGREAMLSTGDCANVEDNLATKVESLLDIIPFTNPVFYRKW